MVSIDWCQKQNVGIKIISPNENMSDSYMHMAEESISVLSTITNSPIWIATTSYYIFYYSLYAVMLRVGIKCGIHACSIEFMKKYLSSFYTNEDIQFIEQSFSARINLQYYADRPVDTHIINDSKRYCKIFFIKTKHILSSITEDEISTIRSKFK